MSKPRTKPRAKASPIDRSNTEALQSAWSSPYRWYLAALLPVAIAVFMYALEADGVESSRLRNPVPGMGEFVSAECITHRKGSNRNYMYVTYEFIATGFVKYGYERGVETSQISPKFTTKGWVNYPSRADCDAALPARQAAKAPHAIWFEKDQPYAAKTTLDEPYSARFLWICLGAIPLIAVGWWMSMRRRRTQTKLTLSD